MLSPPSPPKISIVHFCPYPLPKFLNEALGASQQDGAGALYNVKWLAPSCPKLLLMYYQVVYICMYPLTRRKGLDVDEITIDASANWTAVDKPLDLKDEEGRFILVKIM